MGLIFSPSFQVQQGKEGPPIRSDQVRSGLIRSDQVRSGLIGSPISPDPACRTPVTGVSRRSLGVEGGRGRRRSAFPLRASSGGEKKKKKKKNLPRKFGGSGGG